LYMQISKKSWPVKSSKWEKLVYSKNSAIFQICINPAQLLNINFKAETVSWGLKQKFHYY
jgi:hypothetical protein